MHNPNITFGFFFGNLLGIFPELSSRKAKFVLTLYPLIAKFDVILQRLKSVSS